MVIVEGIENKKSGFSEHFNKLLDMAHFPQVNEGRYSEGARQFGLKSAVTFRSWCTENKKPRTYDMLLDVVTHILEDIPGDYDPHSVIAWLHGAKNPFVDDVDSTLMLDVSLTVSDIVNSENKKLTRPQIKDVTMTIYKYLIEQRRKGLRIESVEESRDAINLIKFCVEQTNNESD